MILLTIKILACPDLRPAQQCFLVGSPLLSSFLTFGLSFLLLLSPELKRAEHCPCPPWTLLWTNGRSLEIVRAAFHHGCYWALTDTEFPLSLSIVRHLCSASQTAFICTTRTSVSTAHFATWAFTSFSMHHINGTMQVRPVPLEHHQ